MSNNTQRKMVEKYLQEHDLETVMNEVVNLCVKERPVDPFLFLSTRMKELSSTSAGIKSIVARQVYDPNGNATVYAEVTTFQGQFSATVPISDEREDPCNLGMVEKRDKDGSVTSCLKSINTAISKAIVGKNPLDQDDIDAALVDLDGTDRYTKIGANAILAVSMACCRAGAAEKQVPLYKHIADLIQADSVNLPVPFFNVIAGGKHVKNTKIPYQEFMVLPLFAKTFREAFELGLKYYKILGEVLLEKYGETGFTLQQVNEQGM
jgi:enolase